MDLQKLRDQRSKLRKEQKEIRTRAQAVRDELAVLKIAIPKAERQRKAQIAGLIGTSDPKTIARLLDVPVHIVYQHTPQEKKNPMKVSTAKKTKLRPRISAPS